MLLYKMLLEGFDFGPFVTKLVIAWKDETAKLAPEDFTVSVTKQGSFFQKVDVFEEERKVTGVSVNGREVTLDLEVHPSKQVGNGFRVDMKVDGEKRYVGNQWAYPYKHTLTWKGKKFEMECMGVEMKIADEFDRRGKFTASDGVCLQYASFTPPEAADGARPLIIWLHGAGEGSYFGTQDVNVSLIGNKVVSFADKEMQGYMKGAYVLVPQAPTMWMDDGTGAYTKDGTTMYETAMFELLDRYLADHPNVDRKRIYLGGCSNGGYMTMRMVLQKPEMFAAAFPVCQAYKPEWVTDAQIKKIAQLPIWQVHARDDKVVPFAGAEETYERLKAAGAKDARHTWYDSVEDLTGLWKDEEGNPWKYDGHWAWIHVFNNLPKSGNISLFEWLARCSR